MPQTTRSPKPYRPGLVARLSEGLRYGGGVGQWSWLAHRLTGLGILLFLIIHVLDTFLVVVAPGLYDDTVAIYGGVLFGDYYPLLRWAFRLGELGLIASVVYHAINGVGVVILRLWDKGTLYRREIQRGVLVAFALVMIPSTIRVIYPLSQPPGHLSRHPAQALTRATESSHKAAIATPTLAENRATTKPVSKPEQGPRSVMLTAGMLGLGFVWIGVLGFVPPTGMKVRPATGFELRAWYLMRISGLLLVFLAVGHLFIMHLVNNVEYINYKFVADRWAAPKIGALWRIWDFAMITLALGHGFNGLRQVLFEYITRPARRVMASTIIWTVTLTLIAVGSYAIFMFQPDQAYIEKQAMTSASPPAVAPIMIGE